MADMHIILKLGDSIAPYTKELARELAQTKSQRS